MWQKKRNGDEDLPLLYLAIYRRYDSHTVQNQIQIIEPGRSCFQAPHELGWKQGILRKAVRMLTVLTK